MVSTYNLKKLSFLVYGLGLTGISVINFFKKHKIKNYQVWDDKKKIYSKIKRPQIFSRNLKKCRLYSFKSRVSLIKSINKNR